MLKLPVSVLTAACGVFLGPAAPAQDCEGEPGYVLDISPEEVPIGTAFTVSIQAPEGSLVLLFLASTPGTTEFPFGTLCIGAPEGIFALVMPADSVSFDHPIECKPEYVGIEGFFQFAATHHTEPGIIHLSNPDSITIVDGDCDDQGTEPGDFVGYTQGGWGQKCKGNNVGCLRDEHFASVFPSGLILGDPEGDDADAIYAIVLTSAKAVKNFLPAGKKPAVLEEDHVDPEETEAGVFAGQLAAAKLNVGFDSAGIFDSKKNDPTKKLADAVFVANVDESLFGMTVAEVISLADTVISGALAAPIDIDGDGSADLTISELSNALAALNEEFDGGKGAAGSLDYPDA